MSDKSAKPILIAGAVGTVALLGIAWMFTASTSSQAVVDAERYAESKEAFDFSAAPGAEVEEVAAVEADAEEPAAVKTAAVEPEGPAAEEAVEAVSTEAIEMAEAEAAETEAEQPAETAEAATEEEPAETAEAAVAEEEPTETAEAAAVEEEPAETEVAAAEEPAAAPEAEQPAEAEEEAPAEEARCRGDEPAEEAAPAGGAVTLASLDGDAAAGAKVFRKCKACHKIGDGAKNAVGPQLTGIVGRVQGSVDGFKYSDGFKTAMAEGKEWTPEELDAFLTKPKDYMPKTKMAFAGLRKEDDRVNVIKYLAEEGQ